MGKYRGYIAALLIVMVLFGIALKWVSTIPAGTPGLISRKEPQYPKKYQIYILQADIVTEVPEQMFQDAEVVIEVATPSQAIEEPKKYLAIIEARKPKMVYFGNMATTGYLATGNPCADGSYPVAGWTVACNDRRLWHKTIYIEGVGTRYVHDTGGMPMSVLDVFVGSLSEAYSITSGSRAVYIVE
jgi:3D (Asp-Asp-Asp) domain-containing protein